MHLSSKPKLFLGIPLVAVFNLAVVFSVSGTRAAERPVSEWVHPGADAKLVYKTTPAGDRIMDFSHAGYGGGGIALPDVPVVVTVPASGSGDDTLAIQRAIDRVALLPLKDGFRGTVLLANGTFSCVAPLTISASGIVLRGSGSGARSGPASTIKLTGKPHNAITVRAPGGGRGQAAASDETEAVGVARTVITDAYVPSGAKSFAVKSAAGFSVGDIINIIRPVTAAWVKLMHMDDLTRDGRPQTWLRVGSTITTERRIAAVSENTLTLDVPLSDSFDAHYLNPPGTAVVKVKPPARLTQIGIENLHIESPLQEISHTEPHFTALRVTGEDCWVRDVVIDETMNSVGVGGRRITLERVAVNRKAKHQGASKPAEFAPNASEVLMDRCTVHADNVWFVATGAGVAGPIVVLNCTFLGLGRSEAHQRWSTGMLYDNCRAPDGGIEVRNRGAMGSGHGWPMGWGVIWNCEARDYIVQDPPGARNWLIGSIGESGTSARPFDSGPKLPGGTEDSPGRAVAPQSLYLAQLAERLGPQALKNIGYASASLDPPNATVAGGGRSAAIASIAGLAHPFGPDLALNRPVLTSNLRGGRREFAGWQALDGDDKPIGRPMDGAVPAHLELDTEGSIEINAVELGEAMGMTGRIQSYKVEGFVESGWRLLAEGTSIGERKLDRFPPVSVWKVRLTVLKAEPFPALRKFSLYFDRGAAPPK